MKPPSTMLLRALLQPAAPLCQVRTVSNWIPREKYAAVTRLDKLHRRQKKAMRAEKQASLERANALAQRLLSSQTTPATIAATSTTSTPTPTPSGEIPIQADSTPSAPALLPYRILRTASRNLPIYETSKAGGSKHITQIRKIQGDLEAMRDSIRAALQLEPTITDQRGRKKETIAINWATRQLVVRGWRGAEVKRWAEIVGF